MGLKAGIATALAGATIVGTVGIAAAAGSSNSASSSANTASSAPTVCRGGRDGEWPDFANGRPAGLHAGDRGGVYLWHSVDGWHLRVTHHNEQAQVYSGVIATSGTMTFERVADERDDIVWVGPQDHLLHFRFVNYGGIDGVDFQTSCAPRLSFDLKVDGHELGTERVFIGHADTNPTSVPFVIERAA